MCITSHLSIQLSFFTCTFLPFIARWTLLNEGLHALLCACLPGNDKSLFKMNAVNKLLRNFFSLYGLFYPSKLHHVLKGFSVFRKLNYGETFKFSGKPVIELRRIMNWSFVSQKRFSCSCFQYPRRGSPIGFFNPVIPT